MATQVLTSWPNNNEFSKDGKTINWNWNNWEIGTPITQTKLENLEEGIAILATQMQAILGEIGTATYSDLISNSSRLDNIQKWITGGTSTSYDSGVSSIASRLTAIESTNTTQTNNINSLSTRATNLETRATNVENENTKQNNKLSAIMSEIGGSGSDGTNATYGGTSRIDDLAQEVWGSNTTSGTSRIDKNDNKIAAIAAELGGTAPDGSSTTYGGTTRLDDLEKEIGGTRSSGNGYTNSRIDTLESIASTHTNELTAIKNELGGSISGSTYGGTTRLDSVITKASSIATEIWGSDIVSGDSRIDKLTTELYGSNNTSITSKIGDLEKEIGGTRTSNGTGYTNSRIDTLESTSTSYGTRLNNIENKNTAQDNKLTAIMNELGGTGNDGSNTTYGGTSRLDSVITEIWGSNTTTGNSRIDSIETLNTTQNTRLDSIEALNTTQNGRLDSVESVNGTQNSRIDSLELKVGNGAIGVDADISAAIRRLSGTVAALDPTGATEAISFLVSEIWDQVFSEDTDFAADSRIDILETTTQNLGTQLTTLATEQSTIEQNLVATNAKIPIEMYIATNSSASDTVVLNAAPQDKSIFFITVPRGTLGTNNLTLQTNDIQFNNVIVKKTYNGEGIKIKYAPNSLISIYRNGSNAYVYNVPMVL